ncbi:hypothetical protein BGW80DRAFT_1252136 [Lactifluus volemus]|nr:hypothetical protein BGW80DRAFT_1252136 [Lactifluus volemus]
MHILHINSVCQGGQYGTQPSQQTSQSTHCDYPTSDAPSFHPSLYGPMGYFGPDGRRNSPPGTQHQPGLILGVRFDDMFGDYYDQFTQHPMPSIPPSPTSSELGNALMEITSPEPQAISRSSIALPTLPTGCARNTSQMRTPNTFISPWSDPRTPTLSATVPHWHFYP